MSATTSGAIKAFLEKQGLGISVFQDQAPPMTGGKPTARPYVTVDEGIAWASNGYEGYSDVTKQVGVESAQVNVWQTYRKGTDDSVQENAMLAPAVARALHGCQLPTAPTVVYAVRVVGHIRMLEIDNNIVHNAITVQLHREL